MLQIIESLELSKTDGVININENDVSCVLKTMRLFVNDELINLGLDFSVWEWTHAGMFVKQSLVQDSTTLQEVFEFSTEIAAAYLDNPYHSFLHAIDMTYMTYYLLHDMGLKEQLDLLSLDIAAMLLAAISHDAQHPGTNNLFQVNSNTDLAKKYHNQSVLENHSLSLCKTLLTEKYTFLSRLCYGDVSEMSISEIILCIMEIITNSILKTDMMCHFTLLEQISLFAETQESTTPLTLSRNTPTPITGKEPDLLKASLLRNFSEAQMIDSGLKGIAKFKISDTGDVCSMSNDQCSSWTGSDVSTDSLPKVIIKNHFMKQNMLNAILHAADISNPARPFNLCRKWSDLVVQEFFNQGDLERQKNLPLSPNMDRDTMNQAQIQMAFTDFIVRPYFETLAEIFPRMVTLTDIIYENAREWDNLLPAVFSESVASPECLTTCNETDMSASGSSGREGKMGTMDSLAGIGSTSHGYSNSLTTVKRKISFEEVVQGGLGGMCNGRRLSMAAGTVEIPDTIDRIFNRLRSRNPNQNQMGSLHQMLIMSSYSTSNIRQSLPKSSNPISNRVDRGLYTSLSEASYSNSNPNLEELDESRDDVKSVPELQRIATRQRRIVSMSDASTSPNREDSNSLKDEGGGKS
ncbi:hypothetical protein RTP6_005042 [Batrachochytrium dendrobatidis]